jgi:hypothetical protein
MVKSTRQPPIKIPLPFGKAVDGLLRVKPDSPPAKKEKGAKKKARKK